LNIEEIMKHPYNVGNWLPLFHQGWEKRQSRP
jgi:galactonate dehydratase